MNNPKVQNFVFFRGNGIYNNVKYTIPDRKHKLN